MADDKPKTTLAGWFRTPTPAYAPLSQVAFPNVEQSFQFQTPGVPAPVGVRGNDADTPSGRMRALPQVQVVLDKTKSVFRKF